MAEGGLMGSLDTRLHHAEELVAALQKRHGQIAELKLAVAALEARVAALEEQRDSRPAPAQAARPAPQQPRYCHACLHMEVRGSQPPCRTCMPYPERPAWQPRGGGG